jgi:serine/threonine protein kinase
MPSNESIKDYNVYEQLGQGGFAQVYRAQVKENAKEVAIKMVSNLTPAQLASWFKSNRF